jgi:hypothetical protein
MSRVIMKCTKVEKNRLYTRTHFQADCMEKWSIVVFNVRMNYNGIEYDCEYG